MASIQEIIKEITAIRKKSDDLAISVGLANVNLSNESAVIASIVQGSRTGQEAVMTLSVASRSLANAASSMKALSRTCDECVSNLSK